jgi:hypothetical protein
MARLDPALLARAATLAADQPVAVVLHFATGDGVRAATPVLRALGFVASAGTPTAVAGHLPAGAVERLASVPGLAAATLSAHRRPR